MHKGDRRRAPRRIEDARLIAGQGNYLDDLKIVGLTFGFMLRSPHAHARIRSIDVADARSADGVLAIITGSDLSSSSFGCLPSPGGYFQRDGSPMYVPKTPLLAVDKVRWVGDGVAFIVAETMQQAQDAAELIVIDYCALPAVISIKDAQRSDSPLVWDDCRNNECFTAIEGDRTAVEAAFSNADHVVHQVMPISRVTAASMEPRSAIGMFDKSSERFTLYAGIQRAHLFRNYLSRYVINVPETKIRVVSPDVGGSFGVKGALYHELGCVLMAAQIVGRPVKWVSTRSEAFLADAHGRDSIFDASLALSKSGEFLAMKVSGIAAVGAWLQPMMPACAGNFGALAGVYRTPKICFELTGVFTNTNPIGPYRGNGRPEAAYIIERLIDIAADEIGMDPAELRSRNYIAPHEMPFKTGLTFTYDSGEFENNMRSAMELADYTGFERRRAAARRHGKRAGIGIANVIERASPSGYESAEIRFNASGSVTILTGSVGQGQGHQTAFTQIVRDRLGLSFSEIEFVQGDTDRVALGEGTGGSRSATLGGNALLLAADEIIRQARPIAAHMMNRSEDSLTFDDGVFSSIGTNESVSIQQVAVYVSSTDRLPTGLVSGLHASSVYRCEAPNFPNGCHICEVEIDEATGVVDVTRYSVVDDVGNIINDMIVEGQLHGGIAQGIGQALMESIHFDDDGQLITASFMDYAMPRAVDMCKFTSRSNNVPTLTNPLGVKGAGEGGCVGALPAVSNALVDALSDLGIRHIEMPVTSQTIWTLIRNAKSGSHPIQIGS
ncbi:xanthine dehydrogenase family protein molybdopterin-binding subunit [Tardiphaga sp. 866_E4_N2_1]|uniref:xanthine dehydrogenase family protein molybdopterin-binding subunit n=1 Tax=unclassified Tardiphaga TaxID=2631404 RepID=UPI003F200708